jgi:predicted NAD-dependent protein-ADP-ribosyltransferase YbiA (DUF1768 family)
MGGPAYVDGEVIEEFDNFEYTPFVFENKSWLTAEQAYQASKFEDEKYAEEIRNTKQSIRYYSMGQSRLYKMKDGFDRKKSMTKILWAKFSDPNNIDLKKKLVCTQGYITFPESDEYWGGEKNTLGKILMKLRKDFQEND